MAITEVKVCNSALAKLGASRITSLSDNSTAAILCNDLFEVVRDEVLRSHPWRFAIKRATLSASATAPEFGYDYQYPLPVKCLRVLETEYSEQEWVVEGRFLVTNETEIKIRYIEKVTDPSLWDSMFTESLAWRLAQSLAYPLVQSNAAVESMERGFDKSIKFARSISGQEGTSRILIANTWANARRR
jgi:hypothetical protein